MTPWVDYDAGWWAEQADLSTFESVTVDLATDSTAVVSGLWYGFEGTDNPVGLSGSPWAGDELLSLSLEKKAGDTTRLGFIVQDVLWKRAPFSCSSGGVRLNYFESLTINLRDREVYANGKHTFSFAQCGIDDGTAHMALAGANAGIAAWNFEIFVVPTSTAGDLEGTYQYKLKAELL